jgi:preprotein translocase SecE subunit
VARDRKRAKQRQQRRDRARSSVAPTSKPVRRDLPGALDHASADVDEFDAAIVRGADGVPVSPEQTDQADPGSSEQDADGPLSPRADAGGDGDQGGGGGGPLGASEEDAEAGLPQGALARQGRQPLPRRALGFLRASWAELQRVQWPDRQHVFQATAVVFGFVAIAGAYLGAADWVAQKVVNFIL